MPWKTSYQMQVVICKALYKQQATEMNAYQRAIQTLLHFFKCPTHQQDVSQRSAAMSHLNMDGGTKSSSKHVKSTMYCIGLFILFHSDIHPKVSSQSIYALNIVWHIFPERTRNSLPSFRRYKSAAQHKLQENIFGFLYCKVIFAKLTAE